MKKGSRESDEFLLELLYLRDVEHMAPGRVARQLGILVSSCSSKHSSITRDRSGGPCRATKPENKDGGMPPKWWSK